MNSDYWKISCQLIYRSLYHALIDITQFAAGDNKVYLNRIMDCFDGKIVAYALSRHPEMGLVEAMLDKAFTILEGSEDKQDEPLILHTDRKGHYRGKGWKKATDLEEAITDYRDFYDNRRIKASLGGSPSGSIVKRC